MTSSPQIRSRRVIVLIRRVSLIVLAAVACVAFGGNVACAEDDEIFFAADLSSDGETSVVDSPAKGRLELWLERATLQIRWTLTYQGLTSKPLKAGLFGPEAVGFNAGLQIDFGDNLKSPITGSALLNDGQFQYLIATKMYVNILTERYHDGEIRGHLRRQKSPPVPR